MDPSDQKPAVSVGLQIGGFVSTLLIGLAVTALVVIEPRSEELMKLIATDRAHAVATTASELLGPMLDLDAPAEGEEAIQALMADPVVERIVVLDATGDRWLERHHPPDSGGGRRFTATHTVVGLGDEPIGRVVVTINDITYVAHRDAMLLVVGHHLAWVAVLGVVVVTLLLWLTTRPLKLLATHAESIARGYVNEDLPPTRRLRDEVGIALSSFRTMQTNLRKLSNAASRVAEGDLQTPELGNGPLFKSFHDMVEALSRAKAKEEQQRAALSDAVQRAEKASQAKSEFLARLSHELRTPLNGLIGVTDILCADPTLKTKHEQELSMLNESAVSMLDMVTSLLDFARVEAGEYEPHYSAFCLQDIVRMEAARYRESAGNKGLQFHVETGSELWTGVSDPRAVASVVGCLLDNAVKFTAQGHIRLRCHFEPSTSMADLQVQDTGTGIPVKDREAIFEGFEQGDGGLTRSHRGLGIGLSLARSMIRAVGGDLSLLRGDPGSTEFRVRFPFEDAESSSAQGETELPKKDGPLKVLLVEDERVNQMVARRHLEALGAEVQLAENGQEALDALVNEAFDLVLMDLMMPVMDGWTATRKIRERESESGQRLPVIAVSANALPGDREKAMVAGVDEHLPKPVRRPELKEVLQRWTCR